MGKADAELCFDAGIDQFGAPEYVPGWLCIQKAGKYWFVKPKLVLNGLGSEADFPTYLTLPCGDTSVDQGKLDTVGIVRCKLVVVCARKEFTVLSRDPKILNCLGQVDCMNIPSASPICKTRIAETGMVKIRLFECFHAASIRSANRSYLAVDS